MNFKILHESETDFTVIEAPNASQAAELYVQRYKKEHRLEANDYDGRGIFVIVASPTNGIEFFRVYEEVRTSYWSQPISQDELYEMEDAL